MRRTIYTIGYEGADIVQFIDTLVACGVEQVLDVREVPISRKPGFSKTSLGMALQERGIGYCHLKALGDPKPGREAMRRGDHSEFLEIYFDHLSGELAQAALNEAIERASSRISVLLCFERNPKECHRTIVASQMEQAAGFEIRNIGVNQRTIPSSLTCTASRGLTELAT